MNMKGARTSMTAAAALLLVTVAGADAPYVYAIRGARIITAAGSPIDNGTIVIRNGLIESVAAGDLAAPPDARIVEGKGLVVYPGLIDMGNATGVEIPASPPPQGARTREEIERWKRQVILRPQLEAARYVKPDAAELARLAAAGITSTLAAPPGEVVRGRSSLINVVAPDDAPQIGELADDRRGRMIVRTPVLLHISFSSRPQGNAYPESLMGVIAFVRQAFLDAGHYELEKQHYERARAGVPRPVHDEALEAMEPAVARRMPVAFEADTAREIRRVLEMSSELKVDPVIEGGVEADQVTADLKSQGARVLFSLNYPARPKSLGPDEDEPARTLRQRANAPKVPAALDKAGILFAFESDGLKEPRDFVKNAAKAVTAGLPSEKAIRALTINAATIAGAADTLGSLEKGKIANLIVTNGDLFDEKTRIEHVFIDGRMVKIEAPPADSGRPGRPGGR